MCILAQVTQLLPPPPQAAQPWDGCFVSVDAEGTVCIISLENGTCERVLAGHPAGTPSRIAWDASRGYMACFCEASTMQERAATSSGLGVATTCPSPIAVVWDIQSGTLPTATLISDDLCATLTRAPAAVTAEALHLHHLICPQAWCERCRGQTAGKQDRVVEGPAAHVVMSNFELLQQPAEPGASRGLTESGPGAQQYAFFRSIASSSAAEGPASCSGRGSMMVVEIDVHGLLTMGSGQASPSASPAKGATKGDDHLVKPAMLPLRPELALVHCASCLSRPPCDSCRHTGVDGSRGWQAERGDGAGDGAGGAALVGP